MWFDGDELKKIWAWNQNRWEIPNNVAKMQFVISYSHLFTHFVLVMEACHSFFLSSNITKEPLLPFPSATPFNLILKSTRYATCLSHMSFPWKLEECITREFFSSYTSNPSLPCNWYNGWVEFLLHPKVQTLTHNDNHMLEWGPATPPIKSKFVCKNPSFIVVISQVEQYIKKLKT